MYIISPIFYNNLSIKFFREVECIIDDNEVSSGGGMHVGVPHDVTLPQFLLEQSGQEQTQQLVQQFIG